MLENALVITLLSFAALGLAYVVYGRFLAHYIFKLDPDRKTPAHTHRDGVDFVPTGVPVLFGHHFASIAGLGPIVGPALAVYWGWLPAVLWVVFGSIFVGAVHDLGALAVSLRYKGRSVGDVCRELIGQRARLLFLLVIFFALALAMGTFVSYISKLFVYNNPESVIPSLGLMVVAMGIGIYVYRFKGNLTLATVVGLSLFVGLIFCGVEQPLHLHDYFADESTQKALVDARNATTAGEPVLDYPYGAGAEKQYYLDRNNQAAAAGIEKAAENTKYAWVVGLLAYAFLASVLPVWLLLQPRDYINSFQLYCTFGLLFLGLVIAGVAAGMSNEAAGPSINQVQVAAVRDVDTLNDSAMPPLYPFLFVTIACGAVSGFHSMVSSGTTVRQLNRETDALPIGYGGMLTEGALAVLVIMACVAGLGVTAWVDGGTYQSWNNAKGSALPSVITGGGNFLAQLGIPVRYGQAFLSVTIVAFALTTLDSGTRLVRFNVEEIFRAIKLDFLANRYLASTVAVVAIASIAVFDGGTLWVLFGTTNQLLAALTLLTVSLFLYKLNRPSIFTVVPMFAMMLTTGWAMFHSLIGFLNAEEPKPVLIAVAIALIVMSGWMIVEAALAFGRGRGDIGLDEPDDWTEKSADQKEAEMASTTHIG